MVVSGSSVLLRVCFSIKMASLWPYLPQRKMTFAVGAVLAADNIVQFHSIDPGSRFLLGFQSYSFKLIWRPTRFSEQIHICAAGFPERSPRRAFSSSTLSHCIPKGRLW